MNLHHNGCYFPVRKNKETASLTIEDQEGNRSQHENIGPRFSSSAIET